jgi:hypothetical protein
MKKNKTITDLDSVTTRVPPQFCPVCFTVLDAVTNFTDKVPPKPGDFTVCIECGSVMEYGPKMDLSLRSLEDIPMHSRLGFAKAVTAIKERGRRREKN